MGSIVVDVDFEAGNLGELDSITPSASPDIQASVNAAMAQTSYGMRINIDDATTRYGQVAFTPGATDSRFRVYLDPNSLTMATSDEFTFLTGLGSGAVFFVSLEYNGANYRVRLRSRNDDTSEDYTYVVITDAPHYVEVHVARGAGTGENKMWVDGVLQATHSNLDNDTIYDAMNQVRLGTLYLESGTSGYFYLDELVIRDDSTAIGAVATTTSSTTSGGTTTTGASTTTLSGSGSTSTVTISSTTVSTTSTATTTVTTTTGTTTTAAPTTIKLRDGPGGHTARAAVGDRLCLRSLDGTTLRETWVEVLSVTNPVAVTYFEYSVRRQSGDAVAHPEGATVVNWGASGDGIVRLVGEE